MVQLLKSFWKKVYGRRTMHLSLNVDERRYRLITLKYWTDNGSFQVLEDTRLIGRVSIDPRLTCDKYLAVAMGEGTENRSAMEFDTPHDALSWLERQKEKLKEHSEIDSISQQR
jgi:hypothetical protein